MRTRFIYSYNEIAEFADQRGDYSFPPTGDDQNFADLAGEQAAVADMHKTQIGEPPNDFDVRSVWDVRPVNGYDALLSTTSTDSTTQSWSATFTAPNGYRAIPRKWEVWYDSPVGGAAGVSKAFLQKNGADLPNQLGWIIGDGTQNPIESFFTCEENTTFGIRGHNGNIVTGNSVVNINCLVTLYPVSEISLPLSIANPKTRAAFSGVI